MGWQARFLVTCRGFWIVIGLKIILSVYFSRNLTISASKVPFCLTNFLTKTRHKKALSGAGRVEVVESCVVLKSHDLERVKEDNCRERAHYLANQEDELSDSTCVEKLVYHWHDLAQASPM